MVWVHPKMTKTASFTTGALVGAGSQQPYIAALYTGSIPAKNSCTQYQDQTRKKVQKTRQHQDQLRRGKRSCILGQGTSQVCSKVYIKQGITNTLALPIDTMLYIYLLCPHSEHQNNPFQRKQSKHFHQRNQFT